MIISFIPSLLVTQPLKKSREELNESFYYNYLVPFILISRRFTIICKETFLSFSSDF